MEKKIVYFEQEGPENTLETFRLVQERLVQERASRQNVKKIVLASTAGANAARARDFFSQDKIKLIVVPHQWDFHRERNPFPEKVIALAGTASGLDTALVMQAASSQHPKRLRINEIICKPLNLL